MLLYTNRLIIEHFKDSDVSDWAQIESDANVRRFIDGQLLSFEEARKYVEMNIRLYEKIGYGRYAVRLRGKGSLIGMCGFLKENYGIDFGSRYSKIIWGKEFGFEAAKLVLNYGFSELGIKTVVGLSAEENFGSIRILEKLGFKLQEKLLFNNTKAFKYQYMKNS